VAAIKGACPAARRLWSAFILSVGGQAHHSTAA